MALISDYSANRISANSPPVHACTSIELDDSELILVSSRQDGEAIWNLIFNTDTHDPVNLGNPQEMTILEFAKAILSFTGAESKITFKDLPVDDPKVRRPDISLAKRLFKWEPKVSLEDGIRETLAYFQENINEIEVRD